VLKGVTRELGRAERSPCSMIGKGMPSGEEPVKTWRRYMMPDWATRDDLMQAKQGIWGGNAVEMDVRQS